VLLAAVALGVACGEPAAPRLGIETRVFVDRAEARVGDPVGVTVEIDTPPGFAIEPPSAPPPNAGFATSQVEMLEPVPIEGGLRHRVLWTLLARDVGEHQLPELRVPLVHPDGRIQPLPAGGTPLAVRSVGAEFPGREAFFDIREAPVAAPSRAPFLVGAGVVAVLALLGAIVVRHRREVAAHAGPSPSALAHRTLAALDGVADQSDVRALAADIQAPVWRFVEARWDVPAVTSTPGELPTRVDTELAEVLQTLERARFVREPSLTDATDARERAVSFLRAFVGDGSDR
jgi:hypothetical protein